MNASFVRSLWWILRLRWDARRAGGRVEIAGSARLRTRVIFRGCGTVRIGEHAVVGDGEAGMPSAPVFVSARPASSMVAIGAETRITNGVELIALERIEIGSQCRIGAGARIVDADFHGVAPEEREMQGASGAVRIGDRVWIGMGAIILKRVRIDDGAVVGAGAVVSADVEEGAVVAGNPARVISRWAVAK